MKQKKTSSSRISLTSKDNKYRAPGPAWERGLFQFLNMSFFMYNLSWFFNKGPAWNRGSDQDPVFSQAQRSGSRI